ncbi:hypothetical protein HYH03_004700 [Edaphochlamys debaryana]|uniref:SET domain-containing protein n=1 Tax=Edaphochlamys debaryana TaxID=47281 RepID=A0A836C2Y6_9CHLO|nr:hypothetical protein HYH03_004700 [Edaphochlamys debaryana]|eukprot:KAG2497109.1 hypothetical protein HYH03_004700 [Edaphochlamys debaryana]
MATPPLVLVTSPLRQRPPGELVVDELLDRRVFVSKWFQVLYDGSPKSAKAQIELAPQGAEPGTVPAVVAVAAPGTDGGSGSAAEPQRPPAPPEPLLASTSAPAKPGAAKPAGFGAAAAPAAAPAKKGFLATRGARRGKAAAPAAAAGQVGAGPAGAADAAGAAGADAGAEVVPLPERREITRLAKVVKYNCFGDDAEDLAACALRAEEPRGHIGLFPEFAMLNHSCAPNTVNYCVGDAMVVRAVAPIKAGQEVTICYLGRPQLLPFNRRMALLEEDYGFECDCVRCTAEQASYDKVDDVYGELYEAVDEQLGPAYEQARAAGDMEAVADVQRQVEAWLRKLYGVFRKALLSPDVRDHVVASMYDAYDLLFACNATLGQGDDASSLQTCLKSIERVSAGSDLHVLLAVRYYDAVVAAHGPDGPLTKLAWGSVRRAHVARYGAVSDDMLQRLVDLNRQLHVDPMRAAQRGGGGGSGGEGPAAEL